MTAHALDEIGQGGIRWRSINRLCAVQRHRETAGTKEGGNESLNAGVLFHQHRRGGSGDFHCGAGRKAKAGQLVRLLNIPLSKAVRFHGHESGKHHADALKDAYQSHHGAAGRAWVQWLADHQQEAVNAVREAEARWRGIFPADYGEQVHRVGARFAILEAALMAGRVITGGMSRPAVMRFSTALIPGSGNSVPGIKSISKSSSRPKHSSMLTGLAGSHHSRMTGKPAHCQPGRVPPERRA
ncbi:Superfamily II helicase and inactivated derivatives [Leclercia adecarboxylata]|nr:Superfamily II helicase and inactivated derivatives [Leclercia adecarboxylata]